MGMESKWIWRDGSFVRFADATLHFLTPGLHYGIGVFEGIRCYETKAGPAVFRLADHIRRFRLSAKALGFDTLPYSDEELMEATKETVARNGFAECYLRPMLWLDGGGWNLNLDGGKPSIGIAAWEWKNYLGAEALEKGIRANVSSVTRHHPNVSMTKAKISGNYVNSFLAKTESVRLGFDEAIMLDPDGYVAECTGANLFVVTDDVLVTTPTAPILEGITRDTIATLAQEAGYEVVERTISRDQLYFADEVFVSGTAAECVAIREIDFRTIGAGVAGPVTRELQAAYHAAVRGAHPKAKEWCTPVREARRYPAPVRLVRARRR
ncbi:MAG TPA: branched-chain amino acid transaminase [Thermoanaerobaculia bacterium]|nr:branched-chain amino acid transaminase [Thermoanaerobaculia bacterium]